MEYIIGIPLGLGFIWSILKNCGDNPAYESWLTIDKAKYPELYE